jgi:GNAT superfamily N-acetyltransferase
LSQLPVIIPATVSLSVRWATPDDARPIAAVHIASWRAAYRGLFPDRVLDGLSLDARERDWREWLDEGGARAFTLVAERDRRIVAFCTIEMPARAEDEPGDVAAIPALYAHPDAFGTGVGGALMDAAIDVMRDAGSCEAVLWMLEGNRRAAAFYERQGWRRDGGMRPADYPSIVFRSDDEPPPEVRYRRRLTGDT